MSSVLPLNNPAEPLAKWFNFAQIATAILSILSTFVFEPPMLSINELSTTTWVIRFLVAATLGFLYIPQIKYKAHAYYKKWLTLSFFSLVFGLGVLAAYNIKKTHWSVDYYGSRLCIGSEMLKQAKENKERLITKFGRPFTDKELVAAYAGETEKIWASTSIEKNYYVLTLHYILTILSLSLFLNSLLQALRCYENQ